MAALLSKRMLMSGLFAALLGQISKESSAGEVSDAPFGLTWGASTSEIRQKGVVLSLDKGVEFGSTYMATDLPKTIADLERTALSFGYDDKLWRIAAYSREFGNDPYGNLVLMRYDALLAALRKKYGRGQQTHVQDIEMWKDADEFLMGINQGRSWHYTDFNTTGVSVQISVRAPNSNTGVIVLIYEDKILANAFRAKKGSREENAL